MRNSNKSLSIVFSALCVAIGVMLPMMLHGIPNAGSIFLPMHIPVLVCGLLCGGRFGLLCGILTPLLSSMLTGMPPIAILPGMMIELAMYGLVTGYILNNIDVKNKLMKLYIALIVAMLIGRVTYGITNALFFSSNSYTFELFIMGSFIKGLPGIAVQLVFIPTFISIVQKSDFYKKLVA